MTTRRIRADDIERGQIHFPGPSKSAFRHTLGDLEVEGVTGHGSPEPPPWA
jgi:hypothetical protein